MKDLYQIIGRALTVRHTAEMATSSAPVWDNPGLIQALGEVTWISGNAVSFSWPSFVATDEPEGYSSYELVSGSLPSPLTVPTNGIIDNVTIDAIQGGTFNPVVKKTNPKGSTLSEVTIVLVGLPLVAPVLANPANITDLEEGSIVSFLLSDGLTNAEGNAATYSLDSSPSWISVDAISSLVSGVVPSGQESGAPYSPVYRVTDDVTELSDTATNDLTVSSGAATPPEMTAADTGVPGCTAAKPSWLDDIPDFNLAVGDPLTLNVMDYLHNGGADITEILATATIPSGLTLVTTGSTKGTFTGVTDTATTYSPTFTGENSVGVSVSSNVSSMVISGAAAPTVTSISATAGSPDVFISFDEQMTVNPATPTGDYEDGWELKVNGVVKGHTYSSGADTAQLVFTRTDGIDFDGNNTIQITYTDAPDGDMEGVSSGLALTDYDDTYAIPDPLAGFTTNMTFDDGTVDSRALGSDAFTGRGELSTYTAEESYSGGQGCKLQTAEGESNTAKFGGERALASTLYKGDELWVRLRMKTPAAFDFDTGTDPALKFLRLLVLKANGDHVGYNDIYLNDGNSNPWRFRSEPSGLNLYEGSTLQSSGDKPQRDIQETYEFYLNFDNVPVDSGGSGRARFWKNGILKGDWTGQKTLQNADDKATNLLLFTYWNGYSASAGIPPAQHLYIDDMTITSVTPSGSDIDGNPYMGVS